jgi:hypothetical protein
MFDDLSKRVIILWVIFLLIGGVLSAGFSCWVAEKYIASSHEGDPLQKQGGLSPAQAIGKQGHARRPSRARLTRPDASRSGLRGSFVDFSAVLIEHDYATCSL